MPKGKNLLSGEGLCSGEQILSFKSGSHWARDIPIKEVICGKITKI